MDFGYWLKRLAAAGVATSIVYLFISGGLTVWDQYNVSSQSYRDYQEQTKRYEEQAAEKIERKCSVIAPTNPAFRDCLVKAIEAYQGDDRAKKDLKAQQDMAKWALALTIISVVGTILSGLAVLGVFLSLRHTRTAITDNREIGEAEVRAYVGVQDFDESPYYNFPDIEAGKVFELKFSHINSGNTPAHNVGYVAICEIREHPIEDSRDTIVAPDPSQPIPTNSMQAGEISRMEAFSEDVFTKEEIHAAMRTDEKRIYLIGRIEYRDVFDSVLRFTNFCYYFEFTPVIDPKHVRVMKGGWIRSPKHNRAN